MQFTKHRIKESHLDLICQGRGSADLTAALWSSESSRRLVAFRTVIDLVTGKPELMGPLPSLLESLDLLKEVDASDRAAFRELVLHPQVGSWAAYLIRRLGHELVKTAAPEWVDLGMVHALAFVAAVRQGRDWTTVVPARAGRAMFPGLGMAVFPGQGAWGTVEAETGGGEVTLHCDGLILKLSGDELSSSGDAEWWELHRLSVGDGPVLSVTLDDIDPFRDLGDPVEPERLSRADRQRWGGLLADAWDILCANHRESAEAMAGGVVSLVPLTDDGGPETRSASTGEAFGSVLVTEPGDGVSMAVALIHEFAHIRLGAVLHLEAVTSAGEEEIHYAPWRDDPRHLPGLMQGIYAFTNIWAFWRAQARVSGSPSDEFECVLSWLQVEQALRAAIGSGQLTWLGERLVEGLANRISRWERSSLGETPVHAAEVVAGAHRAGWRLRHLRPATSSVDHLAIAWRRGGPATTVDSGYLVVAGDKRWSQGRLALARHWMARGDAALTDRLRALGADDLDAQLLRGDRDAAAEAARSRIAVDPDDLGAWSGLAVAVEGPAASVLREHGPLVHAVHRAVRGSAPDPVALANWLALGMAPVLTDDFFQR